jgi:hypothetical protein
MRNWKQYFLAISVNSIVGLILTSMCEGEGCMIVILMGIYLTVSVISYIPYLLIKSFRYIGNWKLVYYIMPSLIMFIILAFYVFFSSMAPLNLNNILSIGGFIVPNTIVQLVLFSCEKLIN